VRGKIILFTEKEKGSSRNFNAAGRNEWEMGWEEGAPTKKNENQRDVTGGERCRGGMKKRISKVITHYLFFAGGWLRTSSRRGKGR